MRIEEAKRHRHSCWVRGYLRDRAEYGAYIYNRLMRDLKVHDNVKLNNYLRMEPDVFDDLFLLVILLLAYILFIQLLLIYDLSMPMTSVSDISKLFIVIG